MFSQFHQTQHYRVVLQHKISEVQRARAKLYYEDAINPDYYQQGKFEYHRLWRELEDILGKIKELEAKESQEYGLWVTEFDTAKIKA